MCYGEDPFGILNLYEVNGLSHLIIHFQFRVISVTPDHGCNWAWISYFQVSLGFVLCLYATFCFGISGSGIL